MMNEIKVSNSNSKVGDDVNLEFEVAKVEMGDNFVIIFYELENLLLFVTSLYIGAKRHLRMTREMTKETQYLKLYDIITCRANKLVQTFRISF